MVLDFKQLIDIDHRSSKIRREAQKIRNNNFNTEQYLHDLFNLFSSEIKDLATEIYNEALLQRASINLNFTVSELTESIEIGTRHFLPLYKQIINGYNAGGMFREYTNFQKDYAAFCEQAEKLCKKHADALGVEFKSLLAKIKSERKNYTCSLIAAITGIISVAGITIAAMIYIGKSLYNYFLFFGGKLTSLLTTFFVITSS